MIDTQHHRILYTIVNHHHAVSIVLHIVSLPFEHFFAWPAQVAVRIPKAKIEASQAEQRKRPARERRPAGSAVSLPGSLPGSEPGSVPGSQPASPSSCSVQYRLRHANLQHTRCYSNDLNMITILFPPCPVKDQTDSTD